MSSFRSFFRHSFWHARRNPSSSASRSKSFHFSVRMASASTSAILYAVATSPSQVIGTSPEDAKDLKHHLKDGKGFVNPWDSYTDLSPFAIFRKMAWLRLQGEWTWPDTTPPTVPVQQPVFLPSRDTTSLRATWLGHACYYVEFPGGFRALFDPVFEERCSPFSFMGPKRFTEQPCLVEDIPVIDAVIISHSHYDHLSHPTVMKIKEKHPNAHFFVPLGNKAWFLKQGVHNVSELDWWESKDIKLSVIQPTNNSSETTVAVQGEGDGKALDSKSASDIVATIGCLPCQHTSARTPFDKNHTLWASWSVESGGKKVWFAGDTGYRSVPQLPKGEDDYDPKYQLPHCPAFKEIGDLRGPFDLGFIPIGAYDPRCIMSPMHANPFDSANIFVDTKCRRALAMHWGTWVLTAEHVLEPPKLLKKALAQKSIPEEGVFDVCDIGESREFVDAPKL